MFPKFTCLSLFNYEVYHHLKIDIINCLCSTIFSKSKSFDLSDGMLNYGHLYRNLCVYKVSPCFCMDPLSNHKISGHVSQL